ncbi:MAG: S24 family peptidase [Acidobacteria bacterium]|nr:S24 family peptidase [Acidobacteriota bacterium]MBI3658621.1 S24 family peptidase [Acidobacteriota bacterium]
MTTSFRRVTPREQDKHRTCIPLLTLKAAAGAFGDGRLVAELNQAQEWVEPNTRHRLGQGMFVAQAVGRSMEPLIRDQDYCLFRLYEGGTRQDRVVLTMLRDEHDPETGASFTLKRYHRKGERIEGKEEQAIEVELRSLNSDVPNIPLRVRDENELKTVAWFLEVLTEMPE